MTDTPTNHEAVNAWMLANGWEWHDEAKPLEGWGYWYKEPFGFMHQDLAAEMYRMSEVRVAEAVKQQTFRCERQTRLLNAVERKRWFMNEAEQLAATNPRKEA